MATATETRQKKAEQDAPESASKPKSAGGTNAPKTKGSRSGGRSNRSGGSTGSGRSSGNGNGRRTSSNGSGRSGSGTAAKGRTSAKSKSANSQENGRSRTADAGKSNAKADAGRGKSASPLKQATKKTARTAAKSTVNAAKEVAEDGTGLSKPKKFAGKLVLRALRRTARKMATGTLSTAAEIARLTADKAAEKGHDAFSNAAHQRLPIQRSVDVAVPLKIAWEEWLALDSLPEGVDTVSDIERDGDTLVGRITGPRASDWEAEVIDEREGESFAWQSLQGSDCAGLVTFHALSDRLTRLELNLDVVPSGVGETLKLSTHLADRRAEADLRRFKARVELINPDEYQDELEEGDDEGRDDDSRNEDQTDTEDRGSGPNDAEEADAD